MLHYQLVNQLEYCSCYPSTGFINLCASVCLWEHLPSAGQQPDLRQPLTSWPRSIIKTSTSSLVQLLGHVSHQSQLPRSEKCLVYLTYTSTPVLLSKQSDYSHPDISLPMTAELLLSQRPSCWAASKIASSTPKTSLFITPNLLVRAFQIHDYLTVLNGQYLNKFSKATVKSIVSEQFRPVTLRR